MQKLFQIACPTCAGTAQRLSEHFAKQRRTAVKPLVMVQAGPQTAYYYVKQETHKDDRNSKLRWEQAAAMCQSGQSPALS